MQTDTSAPTRVVAEVLVGACGLATSVATAALLAGLQVSTGLGFHTVSLLGLLPIGALFAGFAAGSGFYAGARIVNHRPTKSLLWSVGVSAVLTFFLVYWFAYSWLKVPDGRMLRDLVSYGTYLDHEIRAEVLDIGIRQWTIWRSGPLGLGGYVVALLQVLFFALGGAAVFGFLKSLPYCENCRRYFSSKGKQRRFSQDAEAAKATAGQILADFKAGSFAKALAQQASIGNPKKNKKLDRIRSTIAVRLCTGCQEHWAEFEVEHRVANDWRTIKDFKFEGRTSEVLTVS